jgi:hypothetical protein
MKRQNLKNHETSSSVLETHTSNPNCQKPPQEKIKLGQPKCLFFHPIEKHKAKVIMNLNIQITRHKRGRVFTLLCKNGRDLKLPYRHNLAKGCSWT